MGDITDPNNCAGTLPGFFCQRINNHPFQQIRIHQALSFKSDRLSFFYRFGDVAGLTGPVFSPQHFMARLSDGVLIIGFKIDHGGFVQHPDIGGIIQHD